MNKNFTWDWNEKALILHTLAGDIQTCGMDGMTKVGIRNYLKPRYIDKGITSTDFEEMLNEQYPKILAWREQKNK